jgi:MFS family permease
MDRFGTFDSLGLPQPAGARWRDGAPEPDAAVDAADRNRAEHGHGDDLPIDFFAKTESAEELAALSVVHAHAARESTVEARETDVEVVDATVWKALTITGDMDAPSSSLELSRVPVHAELDGREATVDGRSNAIPLSATGRFHWSKNVSLGLSSAVIVMFLAASAAPTPLYATYAAAWHFTPITVTMIFGIYAIAVLASLLTVGSLSDYVGRRPVLIAATLVQAATTLLFITASSATDLIIARIVQGLATGAAAAAVGAALIDFDKEKGAIANAVSPMVGSATGGLLSGLLVQYLPLPTVLVYVVIAVVLVGLAAALWFIPETSSARPGALASLRPHFRLPTEARRPLLIAVPALVAAWALAGFYFSIGQALVKALLGTQSVAPGGVMLFMLAGSGALTVLLNHKRSARAFMLLGSTLLIVGVAITLAAFELRISPLLFVGAVVAGGGFGASFQGAIRSVVPLAQPHERAGLLSVVYVIAYLAMGVPAVIGGIRMVHGGGLWLTAREYGIAVIVLAMLALVGTLRATRERA